MKTKSNISGHIIRSAAYAVVFLLTIVALTSAFNLTNRTLKPAVAVRSSGKAPTISNQARALGFADRVAYQRAIEDVYWQHRIWPAANTGAKPQLDKVMSQAQIEKKVEDYLRNSQALADYWQRPITPDQLQAEMDRIAHDTKQPDVLREIFNALGNDPAVIAECLARPVLAERLHTQVNLKESLDVRPGNSAINSQSMAAVVTMKYRLPVLTSTPTICVDNWTATGESVAVAARYLHTAIWTGSEMIVWGGNDGPYYPPEGGRYNPTTDSWSATTTTNAPIPRDYPTAAVWTGTEMIIWGSTNDA